MTVKEFLDSGIDMSWTDFIMLYIEKFPPESIKVNVVDRYDLEGYPDSFAALCKHRFRIFLDYPITTLTAERDGKETGLCISIV